MPPPSAGILLFRRRQGETEVLLVKPGGPYWQKADRGAWMVPKGRIEPGETPLDAAIREFAEETGARLENPLVPLAAIRQAGGKLVEAFAVEGDFDPLTLRSNEFELEWPPRSGEIQRFPEIAEARWMSLGDARAMMLPSQLPLLDALQEKLVG